MNPANSEQSNIYLPRKATIIERIQETPTIFTLRLAFDEMEDNVEFSPGQFNMVYLYGVGEIAISIVSDPEFEKYQDHTIRVVGRVSKGLSQLKQGEQIGIRGPFGRGWPIEYAKGKDVILITGGLGCAPLVSVIRYIVKRRDEFGRLVIMQGVKHSDDLIWREQYENWQQLPNTQVLIAASQETPKEWPWYSGHVTSLMHKVSFNPTNAIAMMCGPEPMMFAAIEPLKQQGLIDQNIWLSMERNMHCAVGSCGHCQYGDKFICKDGPVFPYSDIQHLFGVKGM